MIACVIRHRSKDCLHLQYICTTLNNIPYEMGRLFPSGLGETLVKNEEVRKGDIIELGGKRRRACSLGVSNNVVPRDAEQGH